MLSAWVRKVSIASVGGMIIGLFLLGAMDEITQPYVNRSCDFFDWLADASGIIFVVLVWLGQKKYRRKEIFPPA
jgi:hypothetical protein